MNARKGRGRDENKAGKNKYDSIGVESKIKTGRSNGKEVINTGRGKTRQVQVVAMSKENIATEIKEHNSG